MAGSAKNFCDFNHAVFSRTDFGRRADGYCHQAVVCGDQHIPIAAYGAGKGLVLIIGRPMV